MPEHEITKRLNKLIKNTDKLVQDIEKDTRGVIAALVELHALKDRLGKGKDEKEDEPDK